MSGPRLPLTPFARPRGGRREDIVVLHAGGEGMTFRDIGDAIGIDRTPVKQIQSGRPGSNSSRSRAAKAPARPQPQAEGSEEA